MTIVSNTTPLCYLTLIGQIEILPKLYGNVHVTQKVLEELCHPASPPPVRSWAMTPPPWITPHSDPVERDQSLADLDPGERTALFLCEHLRADVVLVDESTARAVAIQRGLKVSGTLGVLCDAAQAGLLNLTGALDLLRKTNFRASPALWKSLYTR